MDGDGEWFASARKVLVVAKQNGQMAVSATAAGGFYSQRIGEQLVLEKLQLRVEGLPSIGAMFS